MRWMLVLALVVGGVGCSKKSKEAWREKAEPFLVTQFCKPDFYFRSCFDIDEATCLGVANETIRRCFDTVEIPDQIDREQASHYGSKVGECAGGAFENALMAKRKGGGKCDDPSAWAPRGKPSS